MPDMHAGSPSQENVLVLMYHRIATEAVDPWGLCVSPQHFEAQLRIMTSRFTVITLDEVLLRLQTKRFNEREVCITFDDGYADNFHEGMPLLQKYHCPATFFVCTGLQQQAFWWDDLEKIFLHSELLPCDLSLQIGADFYTYEIAEPVLTPVLFSLHKEWRAYMPAPTARCTLFLSIWQLLLPLDAAAIATAVQALKTWASMEMPADPLRLPLATAQLLSIKNNPLFSIGLHTHTHPQLAGKARATQLHEIRQSKDNLSATVGIPSTYLAYPYGSYDNCTLEIAETLQLDACVTTLAEPVTGASDSVKLGSSRYQIIMGLF